MNNTNIINFSENFKKHRKDAGLSQVELAARMGITPQAVSKWEAGASYPDITLLLPLSEIFGITVDELLCGRGIPAVKESENYVVADLPNDGVLRVVKCIGNRVLSAERLPDHSEEVNVTVTAKDFDDAELMNIEVKCGDLVIKGDLSCNDISGSVTVKSGDLSCNNISGNVTVHGGDLSCEDISGDVAVGSGDLSCGDISGNASISGGDMDCNNIGGNAICNGGDLSCDNIGGNNIQLN